MRNQSDGIQTETDTDDVSNGGGPPKMLPPLRQLVGDALESKYFVDQSNDKKRRSENGIENGSEPKRRKKFQPENQQMYQNEACDAITIDSDEDTSVVKDLMNMKADANGNGLHPMTPMELEPFQNEWRPGNGAPFSQPYMSSYNNWSPSLLPVDSLKPTPITQFFTTEELNSYQTSLGDFPTTTEPMNIQTPLPRADPRLLAALDRVLKSNSESVEQSNKPTELLGAELDDLPAASDIKSDLK